MINARHVLHLAGPLSAEGFWIAEGPGKWSRPLRFLSNGRGWVELMRLSPGARLGLHRHTGEIHALNLQGERRLCTGERVGPGDYVHESDGNVDWWEAVGNEELILFVVVDGTVEYLQPGGLVARTITTADRIADYERHCRDTGTVPQDLTEAA